jgi:hypothetical protein
MYVQRQTVLLNGDIPLTSLCRVCVWYSGVVALVSLAFTFGQVLMIVIAEGEVEASTRSRLP